MLSLSLNTAVIDLEVYTEIVRQADTTVRINVCPFQSVALLANNKSGVWGSITDTALGEKSRLHYHIFIEYTRMLRARKESEVDLYQSEMPVFTG